MSTEDLVQATVQPAASEGAVTGPWLPIETAPRDGTSIIITWLDIMGGRHIDTASWAGAWVPYSRPATHWMPLPTFDGSMTAPLSQRQNETDSLRLERDALLAALTAHQAFVDALVKNGMEDVDGGELQELLVKHGLYRIVPYDPDVHGSGGLEWIEAGDDWYVPTGIARAALTASKATGERT
jgi:hypothetical protein